MFHIKHRWSGAVLFKCELSAEVATQEYRFQLGFAIKAAVKAGANLAGANLAGAYLAGAYLADANLAGANLADAYLADAYLAGANLAGANLAGANLAGANLADAYLADAYLAGANLAGAYLAGAKLSASLTLVGKRPFFCIGPIGSRCSLFTSWITNEGLLLSAGCFFGTIDEFRGKLSAEHGTNDHATEYHAALALIETHAAIWPPKE